MDVLIAKSGSGKTTSLVLKSSYTKVPIVVCSVATAKHIKQVAENLGVQIPEPIPYSQFVGSYSKGRGIPKEVYVDDMENLINIALGTKVTMATISTE